MPWVTIVPTEAPLSGKAGEAVETLTEWADLWRAEGQAPEADEAVKIAALITALVAERDGANRGDTEEDTRNRLALNIFGDGMNEHLVPHTLEEADRLIKWADGYLFRTGLYEAERWAAERHAREAAEAEAARLKEALSGRWAVVFLDGHNEHGEHVLPALPTALPKEYESDLSGQAVSIRAAAEAHGFTAGDFVWTEWHYNEPQIGGEGRTEMGGWWEFRSVNREMSELLRRARTASET